jgi:hypothetical protein
MNNVGKYRGIEVVLYCQAILLEVETMAEQESCTLLQGGA